MKMVIDEWVYQYQIFSIIGLKEPAKWIVQLSWFLKMTVRLILWIAKLCWK